MLNLQEKLSENELLKIFYLKYPLLKPTYNITKELYEQTVIKFQQSNFDFNLPTLFISPHDLSKLCFTLALSKMGYAYSLEFLSLGDVLSIWLSQHEQYKSYREVRKDIVSISFGCADLPNKESGTILENSLDVTLQKGRLEKTKEYGIDKITGQNIWFYFRGTAPELSLKYPRLVQTLKENKIQVLSIGGFAHQIETSIENNRNKKCLILKILFKPTIPVPN